ncbi:5'/3'-nucleotidase SurE, partial [Frankia sp. CNm7]|uniref:5'/3'-nucleotidase SurE n=1 Tax=Frankia nepalensis TaxID=1836974 RepID=UPI0019324268
PGPPRPPPPAPPPPAPPGGGGGGGGGGRAPATGGTIASPANSTLDVLVTSDDGVGSEGIEALVQGLIRAGEDGTVQIVAPAANQSGTGGQTSDGPVNYTVSDASNGTPVTEVNGFPADAVNVALDNLGMRPDLVIAGIHEGQSLGPDVDESGTVGAARAAAQRGIPALAVSLGLGDTYDYAPAVLLVQDWISQNRTNLLNPPETRQTMVSNLNVPNCFAGGKVRGLLEVDTEPQIKDPSAARQLQDCTSTSTPGDEVGAFNAGYATITRLYARP